MLHRHSTFASIFTTRLNTLRTSFLKVRSDIVRHHNEARVNSIATWKRASTETRSLNHNEVLARNYPIPAPIKETYPAAAFPAPLAAAVGGIIGATRSPFLSFDVMSIHISDRYYPMLPTAVGYPPIEGEICGMATVVMVPHGPLLIVVSAFALQVSSRC